MISVVISVGCWQMHAAVARGASALIIRGRVERARGVTNLVADRLERLSLAAKTTSRDFR
jgi:error-prone DNA polymerase